MAEKLRQQLINDTRLIHVDDPGSKKPAKRAVGEIAKNALSTARYSSLFNRIITRYKCKNIIELGTSFGINTLYLAADPSVNVVTIEGSKAIAEIGSLTLQFAGAKNIKLLEENIDAALPALLQTMRKVDFVFMDANHTCDATVRYFKLLLKNIHHKSVIVVDDIHYSAGMERAWKEIKDHPLVHSSADVYRCGILFFDPSLNKQHVILQF
ncbi:MAG TPA: class I SAM-dependent methyltransferase [Chryseosolibacter sp.]|nr:class I SAM-dependent methyltransferase [Chryseosolibacter sp.]